jgi:predicted acylesterase/phospholipase RssA
MTEPTDNTTTAPTATTATTAPEDRFCDLVMKGGITSGVVYPPAICALAREYRFKNIGGTSAGAIAAAVTAAAEYRRRTSGTTAGFELLGKLPAELASADAKGNTQLLRLFQPDPPCRRLFRILTGSLNAGSTFRRIRAIVLSCITSYWWASLASVGLTALLFLGTGSIAAAILFLLLSLPLLVGFFIYLDVTRNVVKNNYGMCKGMTTGTKSGPALTPWLHQLIQNAAARPYGKPLTFGDLWKAPGFPPASFAVAAGQPVRSIDLQMFTTNLTHGRPYIFPHNEPTARLFYNPDQLAPYFPDDVMRWFNRHALDYVPNRSSPDSDPTVEQAKALNLREIPPPEKFPVLIAARMSLSFPLLFAAVPLWAIDYESPKGTRNFRRCMFSDGGISSNFPMHLFDGLIPQWPTFGINLEARLPGHENMIFLPQRYLEGIADRWTRFDEAKRAPSRMGGFLTSITSTMQNWNDNMLARMPGVRDRVVRVRLNDTEGGLNLNMPEQLITDVAQRGAEAAQALLSRFLGPAPPGTWDGWASQRWERLDVFLSAINQKLPGMRRALGAGVPHAEPYADLIQRSAHAAPPGHNEPLTEDQRHALDALIKALEDAADAFKKSVPSYPNEPIPEPDFRVRPPL